MRIRRHLLLVLGVLAASPLAAHAVEPSPPAALLTQREQQWLREHPVIRLAPDPDFKPIEYFDREGVYRGAAADIVGLLQDRLGVKFTIVRLRNWDEVMEKFRRHEVDLLGAVVRTPDRETFALFTDTLVAVPGGILSRDAATKSLTLDDLKGKKVAVVSNYTAHDVLRNRYPDIVLDVVPDVSTGLAKASLGMVDAYVENMANATYYSQEAGITNLRLVGTTDFDYRWGIGIRKDWPELQGILNKGLAAVGERERKEAINRWISIRDIGWRPDKAFVSGVIAAILGLLLAVSWIWNRSLRKAKAAALSNESRFKTLFRNMSDSVYIADEGGRFLAVNEGACRETGYSLEELLRMRVPDIDVSGDAAEVESYFRGNFERKVATFEAVHRRKDGSRFPVEINIRTIEYDGRPAILGVARDITGRRRAEEEKKALQEQLQQAMKMEAVGRLAGGVAHDFNNLLTAIMGNVTLALMKLSPADPSAAVLVEANKAAERAASLTRQLLAFSRKQIIEPRVLDLNILVADMGRMLVRLIGENIELMTVAGGGTGLVKVDPGQVEQIMVNLAVNARDAMPEGGKLIIETANVDLDEDYCVRHPYVRPGRFVMLAVSDTGCGMSDEVKRRIFEPFFTTKPKGTGTGLGLATIYGVVKQSDGSIEVHSEVGKGTTFRIYLPRIEGEAAGPEESDPPKEMLSGSETVLLVEDEEIVRILGVRILERFGYRVMKASGGDEAIALASGYGERIDLLMTDVVMPGMNGRELASRLIRIHPETRVLFTSGYTDDAIVHHGVLEAGVSFIGKPYTPSALARKVREVLDKA